ncbi:MAG: Kelch repeat:Kelch precursor [Polyangiaceae bacterium]|nr:Kelch repeat:Kelch precursor [Polyangiaceae bacterium]
MKGAPAGARPACAGVAGDSCAGACDGKLRATCSYPAGEVSCRDASCSAGKATVVAHCTGAGSCAPEQTVTCENGCEGAICAGDACLVDRDCEALERCIAGTCAPQAGNGEACGAASDCDSGFCIDGVCCDRACDGQCEACDNVKAPGVCSPVSGAPHGRRVQCTSDGSACGGSCDGKSADGCSYPSGTACGEGSCKPGEDGTEAAATVEAQCNGSGRCPAPRQQACGGAGCDADEKLCNGACADGSPCAAGQYCSAGVCVDTQPTGVACQAPSECASGFCVDGYCCGSACEDRCAACDAPGALGTCTPVSGNTHGGRAGCQGGGVCGSQCDGKNVTDCAFAASGTACGAGYCSSGTQVGASSCDGAGQCEPGEQLACTSFSCDGAECSDACEADSDCTRSMQCREGKCAEPYKINAVDEGTCGCRAPGSQRSTPGAAVAGLGIALLLTWRRRCSLRAA